MAVVYEWNIVQMDCYPEVANERDVVFNTHWTLKGTEITGGQTYTGYCYGTMAIKLNGSQPFTPYNQLTKDQVIGWTKEALGVDVVAAYENNVAKQIANKISPSIVTPPLPW